MAWARFDDASLDHPKILRAGALAELLWHRSIIWASRHLTDGLIPTAAVATLFGNLATIKIDPAVAGGDVNPETLTDVLVAQGLWERHPQGFLVHDYLAFNPPRAEVLALRAARSEAGRRGGQRSAESKQTHKQVLEQTPSNRQARAQANEKQSSTPAPSPSPEERRTRKEPPSWVASLPFPDIPTTWWEPTLALFPGLDHEAVAREAAAYWRDHPGKYRDTRRFVRNQLGRAYQRARETQANGDAYGPTWPVVSECAACGDLHHGTRAAPPVCPRANGTGTASEHPAGTGAVSAPHGGA